MRVKPSWWITVLLTVVYMALVGVIWAINDVDYRTVGDTAASASASKG